MLGSSLERCLNHVVARDECRVRHPHRSSPLVWRVGFFFQAFSPLYNPRIETGFVVEQAAYLFVAFRSCCGSAQATKAQSEIGVVGVHQFKEAFSQERVVVAFREEAELSAEPAQSSDFILRREGSERLVGGGKRCLFAAFLVLQ